MTTPKSYEEWQAYRKRAMPHQENGEPPSEADHEHAKRIAAFKAELEEELAMAHRNIAYNTEELADANATAEARALAQDMLESNAKHIAEVEYKLNHLEDALQEEERYRAKRLAEIEAKIRANTQRLLQEHPDWTSAEWEAYSHQQQQEEETQAKKREAARKKAWQFFEMYPEMYTTEQQYAITLNLHRPEVQAELDQRMKQQEQKKQQQEWEKARQWLKEKQAAGISVDDLYMEALLNLTPEMCEKVVHLLQ